MRTPNSAVPFGKYNFFTEILDPQLTGTRHLKPGADVSQNPEDKVGDSGGGDKIFSFRDDAKDKNCLLRRLRIRRRKMEWKKFSSWKNSPQASTVSRSGRISSPASDRLCTYLNLRWMMREETQLSSSVPSSQWRPSEWRARVRGASFINKCGMRCRAHHS